MPTDQPLTVVQRLLRERDRSGQSFARQLGVERQTFNAWARAAEPVPPRRQAQIAVLLFKRPKDLFTSQGYARKEPR